MVIQWYLSKHPRGRKLQGFIHSPITTQQMFLYSIGGSRPGHVWELPGKMCLLLGAEIQLWHIGAQLHVSPAWVTWQLWNHHGYTARFRHSLFYIQSFLHTVIFTHSHFYTQSFLHSHFYTQSFLHTVIFTHSFLHKVIFTHSFLHTVFYTQFFTHSFLHTVLQQASMGSCSSEVKAIKWNNVV